MRSFNVRWSVGLAWMLFASISRAEPVVIRIQEGPEGKPVAARVHLKDAAGKPIQAPGLPFWRDHFVCDGKAELDLPPGKYVYAIEKGPEYGPQDGTITVAAGRRAEVSAEITRIVDMAKEGWWSGETHVHRKPDEMPLHLRAEDLHIAPVMTWWNNSNMWKDRAPPSELLVTLDGNRFYHLMAGEDEREGGALFYFGLSEPLPIAGSQREFPPPMRFARMGDERGAWLDIEKSFWWDTPIWLASGKVDSIGIAHNHMHRGGVYPGEAWGRTRDTQRLPDPMGNGFWTQEIYYHVLNAGLRIPPSAGSASGVLPNPIGYNRIYVHVDGELTWKKWWDGLAAGRCFVTNGPLLRVRANGELPGHHFTAPAGQKVTITLTDQLTSRDPIRAVEVVRDGKVVGELASNRTLTFQESGWFLIRAFADVPGTFRFASTAPFYVEVGGKPRISRASVQFFIDWVKERRARVKLDDPAQRDAVLAEHDAAMKFWEARLAEANAP